MFSQPSMSLLVFLLLAGSASPADDLMIGDWKLNPQRSKLTDKMKVAEVASNTYAFDFGGGRPETIVADGSDQPANFGTTFAMTPVSSDEWRATRKKNGRVEIRGIWTLSKDGRTLHDDFTSFAEDGHTTHLIYMYERRGSGSGFPAIGCALANGWTQFM